MQIGRSHSSRYSGTVIWWAVVLALVTTLTAVSVPLSGGISTAEAKSRINTIGLKGVAIKGYDPVGYFTEGRPVRGSKELSLMHGGVEWRFASEENKNKFAADPQKYMPAYGGYCAYGVAQGYLVKIEPDAWAIRDGKLYLNYDRGVQRLWSKDPAGYVKTADRKWPRLVGKK